ncbi:MAG: serine hydrolase [Devosia sp.]
MIRTMLLRLGVAVAIVAAALAVWLLVAPPDILRVAGGYAAKIVCSSHFIAGRDPAEVLAVDVQAPGHPILKLVSVTVNEAEGVVRSKLFGLFPLGVAVNRRGLGCTLAPDGDVARARAVQLAEQPVIETPEHALWPDGDWVNAEPDAALQSVLEDAALAGPGMRAVVVLKNGAIVAEQYGEGFDENSPLLGWSMAKTVNAVLMGIVLDRQSLAVEQTTLFPQWANDARRNVTITSMLSMLSGLKFNEDYGDVSDVNRMLFLEPDMAAFAASQPSVAEPGAVFNYSSGTAVMLARLWMDALPDQQSALRFPREALFGPLGMTSAVLETDATGTFVGGSYMYATARDWARFGQFLLEFGVDEDLVEGYTGIGRKVRSTGGRLMRVSNGLPGGYSQFQTWLLGPHESEPGEVPVGLPEGTFWLEGHDGQSIAIVPLESLVVVRLGLTPWRENYWPEKLVQAVIGAVRQ